MALISARELTLGYGAGPPLLDGVGFHVAAGERIALVGRNGSGKSTLMKLLAREIEPDSGEIARSSGLKTARLMQEVPEGLEGDVFDVVAGGLDEVGALLGAYYRLSRSLEGEDDLAWLQALQNQIEDAGAWQREQRVEMVISRLHLPPEAAFSTLSGGMKRRTLLARALAAEPDLLLLDEPTNHLDIASIEWLEEFLRGQRTTLLFVTHDRAFLRALATRILELDRGRLTDWPGDYERYLERKREALEVEAVQNVKFDKRLAEEEVWLRRGLKARRTRNEGRVRALERLRAERQARRQRVGQARMSIDRTARSGKVVAELESVSFAYPPAEGEPAVPVVSNFSTTIVRGDKIGILGPNGSGKTTLLKLLLGQLAPDSGSVQHGTKLEVAYFDQHRQQLDEDVSLADSIADGNDKIDVRGTVRHVVSYLEDFLFSPAQSRSPVRSLSGGERNRLLLARLFTRPCNVLVMDEPTNDLDVETLELLEALLVDFEGTLLVVSHDRLFLDHVVTSTLVMEGAGRVVEYAGGYEDWLYQRAKPTVVAVTERVVKKEAAEARRSERKAAQGRKLTYKESKEFEVLPGQIDALESEREALHGSFADPDFFEREGSDGMARAQQRLDDVEKELEAAYSRWEELGLIAEGG